MFVRLKTRQTCHQKAVLSPRAALFIIYLLLLLFLTSAFEAAGVWGLLEKVGLSAAVLQLVLPGLFLEI